MSTVWADLASRQPLEETRYFLILARDLGYGDAAPLITALAEVSRLLNAYTSAILTSSTSGS